MSIREDIVEQAALEWLAQAGYELIFGGDIAPGEPDAERTSYNEVVLLERLRTALDCINTHIPARARAGAIEEAIRKVTRPQSQNIVINNHAFHRMLVEGVVVTYRVGNETKYDKVWLVDFWNMDHNDWLAVNQFTVTDINPVTRVKTNRRPDIVLFVNGLPLVVIELKNPGDENATIYHAFNQLQTYQDDIPSLFTYTAALVIADGVEARLGTITSGCEWFKPWRTVDGETMAPSTQPQLETLVKGVLNPYRLADLIYSFTVFERSDAQLLKKSAGYHQFHAVNKAVEKTILAANPERGDQRVGVVWHTQGSGKSLSMLFYAGKIIQHPDMENPTLVILTDRNDLDDQLFDTFAAGQELLRQAPVQAESREHLKSLLQVASGGVIFTTIQKFRPEGQETQFPLLSERHNIVFIADEAHRSQYGFAAHLVQDKKSGQAHINYGFAKYVRDALPNASFIGFTGTPIETADVDTRQVFGDYIDVYDIQRAVEDGATVPIYYEARLARLHLREDIKSQLDPEFAEITEGQEEYAREKLKAKWAALEAAVGAEERLAAIAEDIVAHFEQRLEAMDGKGMIVCMSRRICVDLYNQIVRLRPEWHSDQDNEGVIKVVMTGSASDPQSYQPHLRNKPRRKAISERFKDPADPMKLVIVRDMWLTGFDAPPLHTMYLDKPMYGHGLMQSIARVNRVFRDKPGGLVVDYLGIAADLREAIQDYTAAGKGAPAIEIERAVEIMLTHYDVAQAFFHKFDYNAFFDGTPIERLSVIPAAMEHILTQADGKKRYMDTVTRLSRAFALAMPAEEAVAIRDNVAFFQTVRSTFAKATPVDRKSPGELDGAVKQLVSQAIVSEGIINVLDAAGLKSPDISILDDEFLDELRKLPHRNLAAELLQKLINDEIKARSKCNVVQSRNFSDMLEAAVKRYQNRAIDAAQVITELIDIAREIRASRQRGDDLGLSDEEMAFYDALAANESAIEVMGDRQLAVIALELLKTVRANVAIDWTVKQSARAKIRILVKRILRKYGYPPDLEEAATNTVLEQAELLAASWAQGVVI